MDNVLKDIVQVEEDALKIEEEAKKQSLEILAEARKKAEKILEESLSEGESMAEELLQKARNEAARENDLKDSTRNSEDEQFIMKSRQNLDAAVDFIVERVVNTWQ